MRKSILFFIPIILFVVFIGIGLKQNIFGAFGNALENISISSPGSEGCKNLCGDGICQEITCMAIGCPCPETPETCPEDCGSSKDLKQKCASEGEKIYFGKPSCCSGLVPIPVMELINNTCVGAGDGSSYCTKCGDGICKKPENKCNCPSDCKGGVQVTPNMPNPSAVYCKDLGYKYEIREDPKTKGQYGVCVFPDGSECGGWAFYRGECGKKWQKENKEKCAKEGEQVNRNPLLGPTNKKCCFGLTEIRVSKSYSICVNCGDGLCKWPEDEFNCPSDCKENQPRHCDAFHKCPFGEECYSFQDQKHPICWKGDPCERCIGKCTILESYPPKIRCEKGIHPLVYSEKQIVFSTEREIVINPKQENPVLIGGHLMESPLPEVSMNLPVKIKAKEEPVSIKININKEKKVTEIEVKDKVCFTKETLKFKNNELKIETPEKEIKIDVLPNKAVEIAQKEVSKITSTELKTENNNPIYEVKGEKEGKLLFVFPIKLKLSLKIDAKEGRILKIKRPWWSFFVF